MEPVSPIDLHQDCLDKLTRALDLVLKTAETASAENNHKIVIQAAREVTRIASLVNKMTAPPTKACQAVPVAKFGRPAIVPSPPTKTDTKGKPEAQAFQSQDFLLPDLDTIFPPHEVASWDPETQDLFVNVAQSYQELQAIGAELAAGLPEPVQVEENTLSYR